jgi:hypothetical protein
MWLRNGMIVRKPQADAWGVLHLRPEYSRGYKLKQVTAAQVSAGWDCWQAMLAKVRAREVLPKKFGAALYPPLPDGSQPPPMIEDLYSYPGCSRVVKPLIAAGFVWLADLDGITAADLLAVRNVGAKTVAALTEVMAGFGLALAASKAVA